MDVDTTTALTHVLEFITKTNLAEMEDTSKAEETITKMINHIQEYNPNKEPTMFGKNNQSLLTTLLAAYDLKNDIFKQHLPQLFSIIDIVSFNNIIYKDPTQVDTFLNNILLRELKKIDAKIRDSNPSSGTNYTDLTLKYDDSVKKFSVTYPDFLHEAIEPIATYIKKNHGNMLIIDVTPIASSAYNPFIGGPKGTVPGTGAPGTGAPGSGAPGTGAPGSGALATGTGAPVPGTGALVPGTGAPGTTTTTTTTIDPYDEEDEVNTDENCVMPGVSSKASTSTSKAASKDPPTAGVKTSIPQEEIDAIVDKEKAKGDIARAQRAKIGGSTEIAEFKDDLIKKPNGTFYTIPTTHMEWKKYGQTFEKYDGHTAEHVARQAIVISTLTAFEEASKDGIYHKQAFINLENWNKKPTAPEPTTLEVEVAKSDWGALALEMTKKYGKIFVCLNMANAKGFGSGYMHGSAAQEENMFRRTDCHFSYNKGTYTDEETKQLNGEGPHSKSRVLIDTDRPRICIKSEEKRSEDDTTKKITIDGYDFLPTEEIFPFIEMRSAAPKITKPVAPFPLGPHLDEEIFNFQKKVDAQLETLTTNNFKYVVLGAFGCGDYNNIPEEVARYYYKKLLEHKDAFKVVVFPIYYAGHGASNYKVFQDVFKYWPDETANLDYTPTKTTAKPNIPSIIKDGLPKEYVENVKGTDGSKSLEFKMISKPRKSENFGKMAFGIGLSTPTRDTFKDHKEPERYKILLETLNLFDNNLPDHYHKLAKANVLRWADAVDSKNKIVESSDICKVEYGTADSLDATHKATKKYGKLFACLNFANATDPGGGYTGGRGAQEENIFYRTDCHYTLTKDIINQQKDNPITYTNYHYTPDMTNLINGYYNRVYLDWEYPRVCIRGPETKTKGSDNFKVLDDDEVFPFYELRSAAKDYRDLMKARYIKVQEEKERIRDDYFKIPNNLRDSEIDLRKRICAQLDTLRQHKLRYVVLGLFGCGVFLNHLPSVARIYGEELKKRKSDFSVVVFASTDPIFNNEFNEAWT